jgi:hypothetical protein
MKKWIIAVIIGVLMPIPINMLVQYLASLQAGPNNVLVGYALSALMFLSYLFLGVFLAQLEKLRTVGTERRVHWPEFALGAVLLILSIAMKLEQATGLVVTTIDFIRNSAILTTIVQFNDGLYLWVVLAGFFLTDAFERVPAQTAALAISPRVKKVKPKKGAKTKVAEPVEIQPSVIQPTEAKLGVQIQPGVIEPTVVQPEDVKPVT